MEINKILNIKSFFIIFFLFITPLFSEENSKPFCSSNLNFQDKLILEKLEIKVNKNKIWSRNLLNLHVHFQNEKEKSKHKNWFENFRIDKKYKKKYNSKLLVKYVGFKPCFFDSKVRITGDLWWHIGWMRGAPVSSLQVEILDGHINNITKFKLFLPQARNNKNEVFTAVLLKKLGFLSPRTFIITAKVNGYKGNYIFQEDLRKEFLEYSSFREGPILEGDERFTISLKESEIKFVKRSNLSKLANKKFAKKNIYNSYVGLDAVSNLNLLYLHNHKAQIVNKFTTDDLFLLTNDLFTNNYDTEQLEVFESLIFALDAVHGLSFDDRRFYFDSIDRTLIPIYYDGKSNILEKKQILDLEDLKKDSSVEAKKGSKKAIKIISEINKADLLKDLINSGMTINQTELNKLLNKLINRLEFIGQSKPVNLKVLKEEQYFSLFNEKDSHQKKLVFTNFGLKKFYVCDFDLKNCQIIQNNELEYQENLPEALNQSFNFLKKKLKSNDEYIFVFKELEYEKGKLFYSKDFSNWKNQFIESTLVQYNENIELQINKDNKTILITQTDPSGIILFKNGVLKNWNIIFTGYKKEQNLKKNYDQSPMNLTGCVNIYKTKLLKVSFDVKNTFCEDALNIIRSNGEIENIKIHNSFSDGLDIDFSNITLNSIEISSSGNDCVDFSFGIYNLKKINLKDCGDKALSVGEKSLVKLGTINVDNAAIGLASKDSSVVKLEEANFNNLDTCIAAYNKKQEFNGGVVEINNLSCKNFNKKIKTDIHSKVFKKNELVKNIKTKGQNEL